MRILRLKTTTNFLYFFSTWVWISWVLISPILCTCILTMTVKVHPTLCIYAVVLSFPLCWRELVQYSTSNSSGNSGKCNTSLPRVTGFVAADAPQPSQRWSGRLLCCVVTRWQFTVCTSSCDMWTIDSMQLNLVVDHEGHRVTFWPLKPFTLHSLLSQIILLRPF